MKISIEVANLSREIASNVRRTTESKENFEKINKIKIYGIEKSKDRMKRARNLCVWLINFLANRWTNT